ncbi:MAG: FAD-binding protein [Gammaproteobacteria bacterium]|nr:FAD-binding protein [Gammaproteobacteria bacterium]
MGSGYDLIVVGAGSAGLPAAIFAAQGGARVLQIEADSRVGGTLHWSSGQISAAGTRQQAALGIEDSAEEHYQDAQRIAYGGIDPVLGRLATGGAADTLHWLMDIGLELAPGTPMAGMVHEPYATRRYVWGHEQGLSILKAIEPVHRALAASGAIELRLQTRMTGLLTSASGAVAGVKAECNGQKLEFRAPSVALTTGGYAANPELWNEVTPYPLHSHCNPFSRGEGIIAAREIGAKIDRTDQFLATFAGFLQDPNDPLSAWFFQLAPAYRAPWEIYVDGQGKRFLREDHPSIHYSETSLLKQPGMRMVIVFDEGISQNATPMTVPDKQGRDLRPEFNTHPAFQKADSIEELAGRFDIPPENLAETVRRYNKAVDSREDPDFNRLFLPRRVERAPFYGIEAVGVTVISPGGVKVNGDLQVVDQSEKPINGLYAAGEILGFTRLSGAAFVGGMSLMPAMTFGRMIGEQAAAQIKARAA